MRKLAELSMDEKKSLNIRVNDNKNSYEVSY